MASNRAKARSAFRPKRSLPQGGVRDKLCHPWRKGVLTRRVSLRPNKLGKTVLTRCYRTGGIIKRVKALCTVGTACIYGARICACFLRYKMKVLLDQHSFTFMTSKGTPCRRYSRVDPIRIPWPCRGSRPAAHAAFANSEMNLELVRGLCPDLWR